MAVSFALVQAPLLGAVMSAVLPPESLPPPPASVVVGVSPPHAANINAAPTRTTMPRPSRFVIFAHLCCSSVEGPLARRNADSASQTSAAHPPLASTTTAQGS